MATHSVTMNRFSLPSVTRYYAARRKVGRAQRAPLVRPGGPPDSEERPSLAGLDEGDLGE
jgi:hypothetical protein